MLSKFVESKGTKIVFRFCCPYFFSEIANAKIAYPKKCVSQEMPQDKACFVATRGSAKPVNWIQNGMQVRNAAVILGQNCCGPPSQIVSLSCFSSETTSFMGRFTDSFSLRSHDNLHDIETNPESLWRKLAEKTRPGWHLQNCRCGETKITKELPDTSLNENYLLMVSS